MAIEVLQREVRLSVIKHVDKTNYGQAMVSQAAFMEVIATFNWNEIIR